MTNDMRKLLFPLVLICGFEVSAEQPGLEASAPSRPAWMPEHIQIVTLRDLSQLPKVGDGDALTAASNVAYYFQYVRNRHGNQCLDGDANTIPANGSKVQLWACHGGYNQGWVFTPAANFPVGWYVIQNAYGGQCLDGDANTIPANGSKVQLWACHGGLNHVWGWDGTTFRNASGWQCLDGDANTIPANGSKVQLWACHGGLNHAWTLSN